MNCKRIRPGFEIRSPIPFKTDAKKENLGKLNRKWGLKIIRIESKKKEKIIAKNMIVTFER